MNTIHLDKEHYFHKDKNLMEKNPSGFIKSVIM